MIVKSVKNHRKNRPLISISRDFLFRFVNDNRGHTTWLCYQRINVVTTATVMSKYYNHHHHIYPDLCLKLSKDLWFHLDTASVKYPQLLPANGITNSKRHNVSCLVRFRSTECSLMCFTCLYFHICWCTFSNDLLLCLTNSYWY